MAPVKQRALLKAKTHVLQDNDLRSLLKSADATRPRIAGAKVIVTLGPSTHDVATLTELLQAGMSCARLDLTCGTPEYHSISLDNLEQARKATGRTCAVLVDTFGRELMIKRPFKLDESGWPLHADDLVINEGQSITLTTDQAATASATHLPVNYAHLPSMVQAGDKMFVGTYLNTGADSSSLYLEVVKVTPTEVQCTAKTSASLTGMLTLVHCSERSTGFSQAQYDMPILSEPDVKGLQLLTSKHTVDYVAVSYARNSDDLWELRQFLDKMGMNNTKMICKLEDRQSLCNFQSLASAADGIIFARGNLGLYVPPEKMAMVQKHVIAECNHLGKPVIITRIVDTMVHTPRCTRAEATDVANAILDGADGLLLGAETLRGSHPVGTVRTVLDICKEAEAAFDHSYHYEVLTSELIRVDGSIRRNQGSENDLKALAGKSGSMNNLSKFGTDMQAGMHGSASSEQVGNVSSFGSIPKAMSQLSLASNGSGMGEEVGMTPRGSNSISPYKLEALASSAVRAVAKVQARLLICFGTTGRTATLLAKYRPPVPILTVVMHKQHVGDNQHAPYLSRQLNLVRGIIPELAHPEAEENAEMMEWAVQQALERQLVFPGDQVVCIMAIQDNMVLKMVSVSNDGHLAKVASGMSLAHQDSDLAAEFAALPCKAGSLP